VTKVDRLGVLIAASAIVWESSEFKEEENVCWIVFENVCKKLLDCEAWSVVCCKLLDWGGIGCRSCWNWGRWSLGSGILIL
jgi:hypothetical protein